MAIAFFALTILIFTICAIRYPSAVLALALGMFAFEQVLQSHDGYFVNRGSLVNIVVGLVICLATAWTFILRNGSISLPSSYWWTLGLFVYSYSTFWWWSNYHGTWYYDEWMKNLPYLITVLFMGAMLTQDAAGLRTAIIAILGFGVVLSIDMAFFSNWQGRGLELANAGRNSIASSVLALAQVGGYVAVIASLLSFERLHFWWLLKWLVVGLGLYLTFQTASRGQTIALIATVLVCAPISEGKISHRSFVNSVVALGAVAICLYIVLPIVDTGRWQQSSVEGGFNFRLSMIETLWKAYVNSSIVHWVLGLGASASFSIAGFYIHNVPVEIQCEEGLLGMTLFIIALGIPVKKFVLVVQHPIRNLQDRQERNTLVVVFALLLFEFILMNKQGSLYSAQNLFLFAIILQGRAQQMLERRTVTPSKIKQGIGNTERSVVGAV